jgi:hypothetical protein
MLFMLTVQLDPAARLSCIATELSSSEVLLFSSESCAQVKSLGPGEGVVSLAIAAGPINMEVTAKIAATVARIFMIIL